MAKKVPCECRRAIKGVPGKICDECQRRECMFSLKLIFTSNYDKKVIRQLTLIIMECLEFRNIYPYPTHL